jgi:PKD repeat protein
MKLNALISGALLACAMLIPTALLSQKFDYQSGIHHGFYENKGQVKDVDGGQRRDIKYVLDRGSFRLELKANSFSYEIFDIHKPQKESDGRKSNALPSRITISRVDIAFDGAAAQPQVMSSGQEPGMVNFYNQNLPEGLKLHTWSTITYRNLYKNIDLVFIAQGEGLKYNFIVRPGANLDDVRMVYRGAGSPVVTDSTLQFASASYSIHETIPLSYQEKPCNTVKTTYIQNGRYISFHCRYDHSKELIVDPFVRVFGTLFGGSYEDYIYAISADQLGNVYIAGFTESGSIATSGAYQTTISGLDDALLVKFDSKGRRIWSTYYGGTQDDEAYAVVADKTGAVYMGGKTASSTGIATSGTFKSAYGAGTDGFVVKFDSSGSRQWGTYFGDTDIVNTITLYKGNSILIGGTTQCSQGIGTAGTWQPAFTSGGTDGYLARLSAAGKLLWGTYYGGSPDDNVFGVAADKKGNIYLTGDTKSSGRIASSSGFQSSFGGTQDAWLARFDSTGKRAWGTYFGGTGYETGVSIAVDTGQRIYLAGITTSSYGIATSGAFMTTYGGTQDCFLALFDSTCSLKWATYFGDIYADWVGSVTTDAYGYAFLGGQTASSSGIATTGAFQPYNYFSYPGTNCFLAKFDSKGSRKWGTFYGGKNLAQGGFVAVDTPSNVYLAGSTFDTTNMVSKGAFQTKRAGDFDGFLAMFSERLFDAGVVSTDSIPASFCSSFRHTIFAKIKNYTALPMHSVTVTVRMDGTDQGSVIYKSTLNAGDTVTLNLGTYTFSKAVTGYGKINVEIFTSNPEKDKDRNLLNDTLRKTITIYPHATPVFLASNACSGVNIAFKNNSFIATGYNIKSNTWDFGDGAKSTDLNPVHAWAKAGTYNVKLVVSNDLGCKDSLTKQITIYPRSAPDFLALNACTYTPIYLANETTISSGSVSSYLWKFGDGTTSTLKTPSKYYTKPGIYTIWLYAVTNNGCTDSISHTVTIPASPVADFSFDSHCSDTAVTFTNLGPADSASVYTYYWDFGDKTASTSANPPTHKYAAPGLYKVKLIVTNKNFCPDTVAKTVPVYSKPKIDFSTSVSCASQQVAFTNKSTALVGKIAQSYWTFGDSSAEVSDANPVHTFVRPGTYAIRLLVITDHGCVDSLVRNVTVYPRATVSFKAENTCIGEKAYFRNTTTVASGGVKFWQWDFGDGSKDTAANPYHTYPVNGYYQVKLVAHTPYGCVDSATQKILITKKPVVSVRDTTVCSGSDITFQFSGNNTASWRWTFGDGGSSTLQNPVHRYLAAGKYTLWFTGINSTGCGDSASATINVREGANAAFTETASMRVVSFTAEDSTAGNKYAWEFGDGGSSALRKVKHQYSQDGTYVVKLTVTAASGCISTWADTLKVSETGIDEVTADELKIELYPNPADNTLSVRCGNQDCPSRMKMTIMDMQGRVLSKVNTSGSEVSTLDVSALKPGCYLLSITDGNYRSCTKYFIIQR